MSCHYSCAACSGNYYYDLCSSCPSTRQLAFTVCSCQSGYYEVQQSQCQASSSTSQFDSTLIAVANVAYYVAIGIHFLSIILVLNRLLSVKVKKFIDAMQVVALIGYYRFPQAQVAAQSIKIMNAFNFDYLSGLVCTTQAPPYGCYVFQNLIGIGFSFLLFILLFFVSYIVAYFINLANNSNEGIIYIRNGKQQQGSGNKGSSLGLSTYWQSISPSLLLLYLDHTAIQSSMAISRVAIVNYWGFLVILPFVILIVLVSRMQFQTINHPSQTTLAYRARHGLLYLYDEQYHFNYIDHIFQTQNISRDGDLRKPFYPQSNLMIIEILYKIILGASTIVFYQYQPYLFAYCCIFLLLFYFLLMRTFFFYQRSELVTYFVTLFACAFSLAVFSLSAFFTYYVFFLAVSLLCLVGAFQVVTVLAWRREREGEMLRKTYELEEKSNKVANVEGSEDDFIQSEQQGQNLTSSVQQRKTRVVDPNKTAEKLVPSRIAEQQMNETMEKAVISNRQMSKKSNRLTNRVSSKGDKRSVSTYRRQTNMQIIKEGEIDEQLSQEMIANPEPRRKTAQVSNIFDQRVNDI